MYVCHCGSNIAGAIDVEALAKFAEGLPGVVLARHYKYMCSDPGQELVKRDIREFNLNRDRRGGLLAEPARADVPPRGRERRSEPLPGADGQHPRAGLLGHRRQGRGPGEGQGPPGGGHPPRRRTRAACSGSSCRSAAGAGRRRRHRRHPGRPDAGRRRQGSDPGRTRAEHRRPHGHVRQDVPHAGLRRLHPHAQDDRRQAASQHQAADLLDGRVGRGLGGQLPRQGPPQAALHRREPVRRLHACASKAASSPRPSSPIRSTRAWACASRCGCPFPQAVPPIPVIDPETCLEIARGKCKQGCVEACGERSAIRFDQQEKIEEYDVGAIIITTGFKAFDPSVDSLLRLRQVSERLHEPGGRAAAERRRADLRQADAPRRLDAQARGHRPLRGQPGRELPRVLLPRLLHVRPEAGPPGPREDGGRGLQLLHRHPHAGQGLRGVLQPRAERRRALHPRQGGGHHAGGRQRERRPTAAWRCRSTTRCWARSASSTSTW